MTTNDLTRKQADVLRRMHPELTDDEFEMFLEVHRRRRLDPFAHHIHPVKRLDRATGQKRLSFITSIDAFRLIAERTGHYRGQLGPFWCGPDGEWRDVWLDDGPPAAAKVGVLRDDFAEPVWSVARYGSYVQLNAQGQPTGVGWTRMPDLQLAKCAEALCLRRAFPEELGGLYTHEEMEQADNPTPATPAAQAPAQTSRPAVEPLTREQQAAISALYKSPLLFGGKRSGENGSEAFLRRVLPDLPPTQTERNLTRVQASQLIRACRERLTIAIVHTAGLTDSQLRDALHDVYPEAGVSKTPIDGVHVPILTEEDWNAFLFYLREYAVYHLHSRLGRTGEEADQHIAARFGDAPDWPTSVAADAYILELAAECLAKEGESAPDEPAPAGSGQQELPAA